MPRAEARGSLLLPEINRSAYNEGCQDFERKYVIDIFPIIMIFNYEKK
jgi:hypothetical protein